MPADAQLPVVTQAVHVLSAAHVASIHVFGMYLRGMEGRAASQLAVQGSKLVSMRSTRILQWVEAGCTAAGRHAHKLAAQGHARAAMSCWCPCDRCTCVHAWAGNKMRTWGSKPDKRTYK